MTDASIAFIQNTRNRMLIDADLPSINTETLLLIPEAK